MEALGAHRPVAFRSRLATRPQLHLSCHFIKSVICKPSFREWGCMAPLFLPRLPVVFKGGCHLLPKNGHMVPTYATPPGRNRVANFDSWCFVKRAPTSQPYSVRIGSKLQEGSVLTSLRKK